MINFALFKHEMKRSRLGIFIICAILSLYLSIIMIMYDSQMMSLIENFTKLMPEVLTAFGMRSDATNLYGFMSSYLYGMILIIFPFIFYLIRANQLIVQYIERGQMRFLLNVPQKRSTIVLTQIAVLVLSCFSIVTYVTIFQAILIYFFYPQEFNFFLILRLNFGLLATHLLVAAIAFLCSSLSANARKSLFVSSCIVVFMFICQMISNYGGNLTNFKYLTLYSLFDPFELIKDNPSFIGLWSLLILTVALFSISIQGFSKKDLYI